MLLLLSLSLVSRSSLLSASVSESDVYFAIGLPFERSLLTAVRGLNPRLKVVDVSAGIERRPIDGRSARESRSVGERVAGGPSAARRAEEESHEGLLDPHTWLDPRLVKVQAANVCAALSRMRPDQADRFESNLDALEHDLDALDARLASALAPLKGSSMFVFHPSFGYFADAYGLTQVAIEESGQQPSARELADLIGRAKEEGVRVIFVQPQFSTASARTIAEEIGGAVVAIDPLSPDYIANMEAIADAVAAAFHNR